MQTAAASTTIAATSNALGVAGADETPKDGGEISLRAGPGHEVESNVPMRALIADSGRRPCADRPRREDSPARL